MVPVSRRATQNVLNATELGLIVREPLRRSQCPGRLTFTPSGDGPAVSVPVPRKRDTPGATRIHNLEHLGLGRRFRSGYVSRATGVPGCSWNHDASHVRLSDRSFGQ